LILRPVRVRSNFNEFSETISSGPISCDACTFVNAAAALCCEMCFRPNSRVMQLACTWEWRASEQDPWMAFDAASIAQIEAAFGAGHPSVALSHGFFAAHRGAAAYEVHFDRSARRQHFQINTHTGNRRRVRRIGNGTERVALSFILFWPVQCLCLFATLPSKSPKSSSFDFQMYFLLTQQECTVCPHCSSHLSCSTRH
jgi:hypothetical protein